MKEHVRIGTIVRGFGIKGEVKVRILTDFPMDRFKVKKTLMHTLNDVQISLVIESVRYHQNHVLLKFKGYEDLTSVEPLVLGDLFIPTDTLQEDKTVYFYQLEGCTVIDEAGELKGTVTEVFEGGKHPILRVKSSSKDILIPYVPLFIKNVNKETHVITVQWMEGL